MRAHARLLVAVLVLVLAAPAVALADDARDDSGPGALAPGAPLDTGSYHKEYRQAVADGKAVHYPASRREADGWRPMDEFSSEPMGLPGYRLSTPEPIISTQQGYGAPPPGGGGQGQGQGQPARSAYQPPDYTLRLWTLFAAHKFDHAPTSDAIGWLVEGGLEFGLPTFGRPGSSLALTVAVAGGWQGYHEDGPNPSTAHLSTSFLVGYQWSWHENDAFQMGGFFRFDFAFRRLKFSDGSPAIGGDGVVGTAAGFYLRYVFKTGFFILPAGVFFGWDLSGGDARDFMIGVDLGGMIGLLITLFFAALDNEFRWHSDVHIHVGHR